MPLSPSDYSEITNTLRRHIRQTEDWLEQKHNAPPALVKKAEELESSPDFLGVGHHPSVGTFIIFIDRDPSAIYLENEPESIEDFRERYTDAESEMEGHLASFIYIFSDESSLSHFLTTHAALSHMKDVLKAQHEEYIDIRLECRTPLAPKKVIKHPCGAEGRKLLAKGQTLQWFRPKGDRALFTITSIPLPPHQGGPRTIKVPE